MKPLYARLMAGVLTALALSACAGTERQPDPIVGCWQRQEDGYALVFGPGGRAAFVPSEEAASLPVSVEFPRMRWSKRGDGYALRFDRTAIQAAHTAFARIDGDRLVIDDGTPRHRASRATCFAYN